MKKSKFIFDFLLFEIEKILSQTAEKIHQHRISHKPNIKNLKGKIINLDLGCGGAKKKNYLGIDAILGPSVDIQYDLTKGIPFKDKTISQIYTSHFLEHLPHKTIPFTIKECARVLKNHGIIEIEVPDLDAIIQEFSNMDEHNRWESGWDWIFGNQRTEFEYHRTGFSKNRLTQLLYKNGFSNLKLTNYMDGQIPSIRVIAQKVT